MKLLERYTQSAPLSEMLSLEIALLLSQVFRVDYVKLAKLALTTCADNCGSLLHLGHQTQMGHVSGASTP